MKNTYTVPVKLTEDLLQKLLVICENEGRTPSNQFIFMLRNNIAYYEKTHGKITPEQMKKTETGDFVIASHNISES